MTKEFKIFFGTIVLSTIVLLLPASVLANSLLVPFTSQAPDGRWVEPWFNACEETSVAMVDNFYQNSTNKKITKNKAKKDILQILKIKESRWGKSLDENAEKIVELINNYLPWEAKIVENPTIEDIKNEIDNNQPVIIPAYGKALQNKYFRNGGPIYHMLVISGYDDATNEFITEEPGTIRGLDFRYSYDKLINAIHNFVDRGKTKDGPKVAIFTSKELTTSAELDADNDGLTKAEEIKYGTITWTKDSDNDGYSDGAEVKSGYSPTKKFEKIQ